MSLSNNVKCEECMWWVMNGDGTQRVCHCMDNGSAVAQTTCTDDVKVVASSSSHRIDGNEGEVSASLHPLGALHQIDEMAVVFPDEDDEGDDDREPTMQIKDLPINLWYRVEDVQDFRTKFGPSKLLTLYDKEMKRFTVWATKVLLQSIDKKWKEIEDGGGFLFLRPLGLKKSSTSSFSYYDFKFKVVN